MTYSNLKEEMTKAVDILRAGGLVAIPTETVYGLGADAHNPAAVQKIFQAKQRPSDHPLIVHIGEIDQLHKWAVDISPAAWLLAKTFWPGPLTLILKKVPGVIDQITGGQETVGLRIPNHPVALAVLKTFGGGVAAPSANRFGRISPTTAEAVREELGDAVDLILEGGQCSVGVESTIVDVSGEQVAILRPGMIKAEQIAAVLHQPVAAARKNAPRVSGSLELHYAPVTPTKLMSTSELRNFLRDAAGRFVILALSDWDVTEEVLTRMPSAPEIYAHDLYQVLRELDKRGLEQIIIEAVPEGAEWEAIRDRICRAASA